MDEAQTAAWQSALVEALLATDDVEEVRQRLRAVVPWASEKIDRLDARAVAVAIDLVRKWSPEMAGRERG
jgi:hypothetical protein